MTAAPCTRSAKVLGFDLGVVPHLPHVIRFGWAAITSLMWVNRRRGRTLEPIRIPIPRTLPQLGLHFVPRTKEAVTPGRGRAGLADAAGGRGRGPQTSPCSVARWRVRARRRGAGAGRRRNSSFSGLRRARLAAHHADARDRARAGTHPRRAPRSRPPGRRSGRTASGRDRDRRGPGRCR